MKNYHKICISCPAGCHLDIAVDDNGQINIAGNTCPKGKTYGINEITNPKRVVTAVVKAKGDNRTFVPVKSSVRSTFSRSMESSTSTPEPLFSSSSAC